MATEEDIRRVTRDYVRRLGQRVRVQRAILTGSWARGTYLEDSDVDMIVVSDDFEDMSLAERLVFLQKHWKAKIPLEAFGYTMSEFRTVRRISSYVKDGARHGITIFQTS